MLSLSKSRKSYIIVNCKKVPVLLCWLGSIPTNRFNRAKLEIRDSQNLAKLGLGGKPSFNTRIEYQMRRLKGF